MMWQPTLFRSAMMFRSLPAGAATTSSIAMLVCLDSNTVEKDMSTSPSGVSLFLAPPAPILALVFEALADAGPHNTGEPFRLRLVFRNSMQSSRKNT